MYIYCIYCKILVFLVVAVSQTSQMGYCFRICGKSFKIYEWVDYHGSKNGTDGTVWNIKVYNVKLAYFLPGQEYSNKPYKTGGIEYQL